MIRTLKEIIKGLVIITFDTGIYGYLFPFLLIGLIAYLGMILYYVALLSVFILAFLESTAKVEVIAATDAGNYFRLICIVLAWCLLLALPISIFSSKGKLKMQMQESELKRLGRFRTVALSLMVLSVLTWLHVWIISRDHDASEAYINIAAAITLMGVVSAHVFARLPATSNWHQVCGYLLVEVIYPYEPLNLDFNIQDIVAMPEWEDKKPVYIVCYKCRKIIRIEWLPKDPPSEEWDGSYP